VSGDDKLTIERGADSHICVDRAAKLAMANEGREAQQKDEEVNSRKRKAEDEKV
jgi:hypothetical protein